MKLERVKNILTLLNDLRKEYDEKQIEYYKITAIINYALGYVNAFDDIKNSLDEV